MKLSKTLERELISWKDDSVVVEIPEAPEARYEQRSKGIEMTELLGKPWSVAAVR